MSIESQVESLLGPVVATLDVELLDVEFTGGVLRLTVDAADGVSTDALAAVNRLVGPLLDQHDPIPGRYTLEVSSPGLERPLRRPDHFRRAVDETVVVKLGPGDGPRRFKGRLVAVDDDTISVEAVEIDGVDLTEPRTERFDLDQVDSARTVFEWGPTPKPGGGGAKRANKSGARKQSGRSTGRSRGVR